MARFPTNDGFCPDQPATAVRCPTTDGFGSRGREEPSAVTPKPETAAGQNSGCPDQANQPNQDTRQHRSTVRRQRRPTRNPLPQARWVAAITAGSQRRASGGSVRGAVEVAYATKAP